MSLVRSRRVFGPTAAGINVDTVLYTVPADRTLILKTLLVCKTSSTNDADFALRVNGTSSGLSIWESVPLTGITTWQIPGGEELILNPGDTLHIRWRGTTNVVRVTGMGSLLDGAPV